MPVRIPYLHGDEAAPLQEAIGVAADASGVHPALVAVILNHAFEEIAEQVSRGTAVRIPGFGIFATKTYRPAYKGLGRSVPAFSASRGYRNLVSFNAPKGGAGERALKSHRANHCLGDWSEELDRFSKSMMLQRQTYWKQYESDRSSAAWQLTHGQRFGTC